MTALRALWGCASAHRCSIKLRDYLAQSLSPSVERVTLQGELCEFARLQHGGRWLDVAARYALAFPVAVIEAKRDG